MARRRFPHSSIPGRPDRRRSGGSATDAQRPARRGRPGEVERIAERRTIALELRKAGAPYREIARHLGVDVHTAHADVGAELAALRETAVAGSDRVGGAGTRTARRDDLGAVAALQEGSAAAVS